MTYRDRFNTLLDTLGAQADQEVADAHAEASQANLAAAQSAQAAFDATARAQTAESAATAATARATAAEQALAAEQAKTTSLTAQVTSLTNQVAALNAQVADLTARLQAATGGGVTQPSGAGITRYQDIPAQSRPSATIAKAGVTQVSFPPSLIETSDFLDSGKNAGFIDGAATALLGSGIDKTVFQVKAGSSSKAGWYTDAKRSTAYAVGDVRCTNQGGWVMRCTTAGTTGATAPAVFAQVNNGGQYTINQTIQDGTVVWTVMDNVNLTHLMLLGNSNPGLKLLQDFSVVGTELGHIYNGIRVGTSNGITDFTMRRVKVKGIPGTNGGNPGETFSEALWHVIRGVMEDCEADGRNAAGATVAASLGALNSCQDITVRRGNFHHGRAGIAAWQTQNIRYEGTIVTDVSSRAFSHERCSGTIVLDKVQALRVGGTHAKFDSDQGSAIVTIIDPVIDGGAPTPTNPFKVCVHDNYMTTAGKTPGNLQRKEDITLILNGVVRNDCLKIQNT